MSNGNLSNILGGPWAPPPEKLVAPPETQLIDAMRAAGLEPPEEIHFDGKIHRFRSGTKARLATVTSQAGIWCLVMASQPVASAAGEQAWK